MRDRIQESGVRSENEEHLLPAFCLLLSPFRRLPTAFEGPQVSHRAGRDLRYACPLPTAHCLLHLREAGWRGLLAGMAAPRQDVAADRERKTSVLSQKFVYGVSPDVSGRKSVAHGVSRGYANPPSPPSPLPPARERGAEGGVRTPSPKAGALGYPALRDPCRGCGTATRNWKTLLANF